MDSPPDQDCNAATVAAYAAWTKLPEDFLRSLDLADTQHQHRPALRIPYRDRTGAEHGCKDDVADEAGDPRHQREATDGKDAVDHCRAAPR